MKHAPRRLQQMRCVVAVLVACTPQAAAAAALVARGQPVLESGAPAGGSDDVHQPFTNVLSNVHATLFNVTRDVETVEQSGPSSGPASQLRQHTESALHEIEQVLAACPRTAQPPPLLPSPHLRCVIVLTGVDHVAQGIESLRHVRRGVETSERLSPPVKTQVHMGHTSLAGSRAAASLAPPRCLPGAVGPR